MANKQVSEEVLQELTNKIQEIVNNYCWNLEHFTDSEVDDFFQASADEVTFYNGLINDKIESQNFLWSSKKIAEELAKSIIEANSYADNLVKNISSIKLKYVTSLPTSDMSENTIYILKASDGSSKDTLNLYNATDGWTSIGDFSISLDDYYDKTEIDTKMDLKANKTEVVANDKIVQTLDSATNSNDTILSTSGLQVEMDKKANDDEVIKKTDLDVSQTDLMQYVNTDLFDTTNATVNVVKCGRNVQLNIQGLKFKQDMEGLNNLLILNAIPEEYRPLIMTETTVYATTGNISGRGFLNSDGEIYNFFYYDSTKNSPKISGYLFGTFNYISAK